MKGHLSLETAPAVSPLTLEETKRHLRVVEENTDDDAYIQELIDAATAELDGENGWLGRALITQTWTLHMDRFPASDCGISIPLPPLVSVTEIRYFDSNNDAQVLDADYYTVDGRREPGQIKNIYGRTWPSTYPVAGAVEIEFIAGYGDAPEDVDALIRHYLKLRIGQWYATRESVIIGSIVNEMPHFSTMLDNLRIRV